MAAFYETFATPGARTGECAPAVCPECGGLECLCRPRFFAGQLLTDEDLNLLDHYIVEKGKLHNRYLQGWGVVCGLEVVCNPCNAVTVRAGYALGPCGEDIVVCADQTVDVCALIKKCRDTERRRRGRGGRRLQGRLRGLGALSPLRGEALARPYVAQRWRLDLGLRLRAFFVRLRQPVVRLRLRAGRREEEGRRRLRLSEEDGECGEERPAAVRADGDVRGLRLRGLPRHARDEEGA